LMMLISLSDTASNSCSTRNSNNPTHRQGQGTSGVQHQTAGTPVKSQQAQAVTWAVAPSQCVAASCGSAKVPYM
jgi:hypothetical protein